MSESGLDFQPLDRAIATLEEALELAGSPPAREVPRLDRYLRMACIQAFESTYELSWKRLKRFLVATEPSPEVVEEMTFFALVRTGWERGLLPSGWSAWQDFRKARGTTSHTDDETKADAVFAQIPAFLAEVRALRDRLKARA